MKFGIFINYLESVAAATSSYEQSILKAFERSNSRHEFYVFTNSDLKKLNLEGSKKITYVDINEFKTFPSNRILKKIARVFYKVVFRIFKMPKVEKRVMQDLQLSPLNKALRKHSIRLFWQAFSIERIDVPNILTMYDCNDRVHPYFPEFTPDVETWDTLNKLRTGLCQQASYILVGTETLKKEVATFYGVQESKIRINPLFVPEITSVKSYANTSKIQRGNLSSKFIFYPSRLLPHKNHVVIILALKYLKEEYKLEVPCYFVGSDKGNGKFISERIVEHGLKEQVKYLGEVSFEDLSYLYKNAMALVYSTFNGPDNLPPLEAFSLGCPVIASRVSGAHEQLGDNALLFECTDYKQLALHIYNVYQDENLRASLIEKGLKRAAQWKADDYVKEVIAIVDEFETIGRAWDSSFNEVPNKGSR